MYVYVIGQIRAQSFAVATSSDYFKRQASPLVHVYVQQFNTMYILQSHEVKPNFFTLPRPSLQLGESRCIQFGVVSYKWSALCFYSCQTSCWKAGTGLGQFLQYSA